MSDRAAGLEDKHRLRARSFNYCPALSYNYSLAECISAGSEPDGSTRINCGLDVNGRRLICPIPTTSSQQKEDYDQQN
jgi:hypothetical protein